MALAVNWDVKPQISKQYHGVKANQMLCHQCDSDSDILRKTITFLIRNSLKDIEIYRYGLGYTEMD